MVDDTHEPKLWAEIRKNNRKCMNSRIEVKRVSRHLSVKYLLDFSGFYRFRLNSEELIKKYDRSWWIVVSRTIKNIKIWKK